MGASERAAVVAGLDHLHKLPVAYIERVLNASWPKLAAARTAQRGHTDLLAVIGFMLERWDSTFRTQLPSVVRSYLHEARELRNDSAHQGDFTADAARRALDTMRLIAEAIGERWGGTEVRPPSQPTRPASPPARPSTPLRSAGVRLVSQRDIMRRLYRSYGDNTERLVAEYATAERRG
jgi:hypothetical protein